MYQPTVLIVEDEILIRLALADTFVEGGYHVVEAANVLEAVAVLANRKIDAIVTDVDMPGALSGLDLAEMVSTTQLKVPVIIASGRHRLTGEGLPGNAVFVPKPYAMDVIVAMVDQLTGSALSRLTA